MRREVTEAIRRHFRPEFLNRIDETIIFHALDMAQMTRIIDIQITGLLSRLSDRKIRVELTDAAKQYLVSEGYEPAFGARPLKRVLQRRVLDPLALRVLEGEVREGDQITVDTAPEGLVFRKGEPVAPPS